MDKIEFNGKSSENIIPGGLFFVEFEKMESLPSINRETIKGEITPMRDAPSYYGVKDGENLIYPLSFCKHDGKGFTIDEIEEIEKWLYSKKIPADIYMYDGDNNWIYNGIFVAVSWRVCGKLVIGADIQIELASRYRWKEYSETFETTDNLEKKFKINIQGSSYDEDIIYPIIEVDNMYGNISLKNNSDEKFVFDGYYGKCIFNCDKRNVLTNQTYGDLGWGNLERINWFKLHYGENLISVTGKCKVKITYRIKHYGIIW